MAKLRERGTLDAADLCAFIDASPTPFHAAREAARRLGAGGYTELSERDDFVLSPGDKRFVIRGGSTIVAFAVGTEPAPDAGFRIIGAHTDSPNLRVKPNADASKQGYRQLGVEVYGGALYSTWMDRDLSIAGRVLVRRDSRVEPVLVDLSKTVCRVPNLAIHLNRGVNTDGLVLNAQKHLAPILGLGKDSEFLKLLARAADDKVENILGYDAMLYGTEKAAIAGVDDELVFAARLDNLGSCHSALRALLASPDAPHTRVIVLYDHEECGSRSAVGAAGTVLRDVLRRITDATKKASTSIEQATVRAISHSLLISADMAHAVHPNYADQHEPQHLPHLGRGMVIKSNSNQSYATNGETAARFTLFCEAAGYEPQRFVVRSDLPCGSTIGPITAAELGIQTVDVGAPMLSMHSCRELAGTLDVHLSIETLTKALS
ncbi:MAG: M18 family aminopeptidase [Polyangiaceae bacterium]|nr:M18 family aminopeptidase [Polyangiaceae bacterium]